MSSGASSFPQVLSAFLEELRKRLVEEHDRDLKRKLAVVLQENSDFRQKLGLPPDEDEALELTDLQPLHPQINLESPDSRLPNGFTLGSAGPELSPLHAVKEKAPQTPLKSALKKKGPGGRLSRRCSTQPAGRLSRQNSMSSTQPARLSRQNSMVQICESSIQSHIEGLQWHSEEQRLANPMHSPMRPINKMEVPPPAEEPESLVLPNVSPIKVLPPKDNGFRGSFQCEDAPMRAFGPLHCLQSNSGTSKRASMDHEAAKDSSKNANSENEVTRTASGDSDENDPRPAFRKRRSLSNPPALSLYGTAARASTLSRGAAETGSLSPRRLSQGQNDGTRRASGASGELSPKTIPPGGHSFVSDLPAFQKKLGHSKTQEFNESLSQRGDEEKDRRFSWLRNRLPQAMRRGSSFSSQVGMDSRNNSLIGGSRKTSAILQAVKNLHVRFTDDKNTEEDTSSEDEETGKDDRITESYTLEEDDDCDQHFWLAQTWLEKNEQVKTVRKTPSNGHLLFEITDGTDVLGVEELRGATTTAGRRMERFVIHPKSGPRMLWALCGCLLYLYDAIVIPLQFFALDFPLQRIIRWLVCIYWTIDIPLSFFNGTVQMHGTIELRPEKIVWRYVRTWFIVDVFMVIMDWLQLARDNDSSEWGLIRIRKVARATRIFRLFWSIKLMQTVSLPEQLRIYLLNERFIIIIDIVKIIIVIVGVNHLIACFWYGIGTSNQQYSWAAEDEFREAGTEDLYAVSFLWSLSQFTGSLDINMPRNPNERAFSIFVLLFTFVFSAFAISSITSSMTQLQIITAQQSRQFAALRRYLNANSISKALAMRIHRSARNAVEDLAKNTPERSVELLQLVSDPLRQELHYEVHAPALMVHSFFKYYNRVYEHALRQICHNAVSHLSLHRGDLLFSNGEMPSEEDLRMFFFLTGRLTYSHHDKCPSSVKAGAWACEAAIWTMWPYHGTMRAKADCSLTLVDAHKFQKIACQFMSRNVNPVLYGKEFVKCLNQLSRRDLTDLELPLFRTEKVAQAVFCPEEVQPEGGRRSSDRRHSDISIRGSSRGWLPSLNLPSRLSRLTEAMDRQSTADRASSLERASRALALERSSSNLDRQSQEIRPKRGSGIVSLTTNMLVVPGMESKRNSFSNSRHSH